MLEDLVNFHRQWYFRNRWPY